MELFKGKASLATHLPFFFLSALVQQLQGFIKEEESQDTLMTCDLGARITSSMKGSWPFLARRGFITPAPESCAAGG